MLDAGTTAPALTVPDHGGAPFDLTAERGHWVLLWSGTVNAGAVVPAWSMDVVLRFGIAIGG